MMMLFLSLVLGLVIAGIVCKCVFLGINQYPRTIVYLSWHDVLGLLCNICWAIWIICLLRNLA